MSFMLTASGAEYHFTGSASYMPGGRPVNIGDIAHQLSMINRFHGATVRPYSVAEHSLLVSEIAQRNGHTLAVQFAALMHDAHEIYTQDLASPAKVAINQAAAQSGGTSAWGVFEREHEKNVRRFFGLLTVFTSHRTALQKYDLQALATERRDLIRFDPYLSTPWDVLTDVEPIDWIRLNTPEREAMQWYDWRLAFQNRFDEIAFGLGLNLAAGAIE